MIGLWIGLGAMGFFVILIGGMLIGFQLRKPCMVGSLLIITDPNDGEKYMTLEIKKKMAEEIYEGNEVTVKVIERTGKFPQKKQAL
jgi:hypothetical protein